MTDEKQPADWRAIERDYRAGIKPLRQIGAEHGVTEGAIRKRAKRDDWVRDLGEKIRQKADEIVRRDAVRTEQRRADEGGIVASNAEMQAAVRREHRRDISGLRAMVGALLDELGVITTNRDAFEAAVQMLAAGDDVAGAAALQKAISLPMRAGTLEKLVNCMAKLVPLEREAFGIDDKAKEESPLEKLLREIDLAEGGE